MQALWPELLKVAAARNRILRFSLDQDYDHGILAGATGTVAKFIPGKEITVWFLARGRRLGRLWSNTRAK